MIDEPALRRAFSDFAEALLERYDIGHMLYRLTDQAVEVLGVEGAGVSLRGGPDELQFVTATDARSSRAERAQIDAADGPCYEAFRSGRIVPVSDLEQDARWPGFRGTALEQGFHAAAGIPMPVSSEPIGALNLYASSAREWQQVKACSRNGSIALQHVRPSSSDPWTSTSAGPFPATSPTISVPSADRAVFAHFRDKQHLQRETIRAALGVFEREVVSRGAAAPPGRARLEALCEVYLSYIEREVFPGGCLLAQLLADYDARRGPIHDELADGQRGWLRLLTDQATTAQDRAELDAIDPVQLAFELYAPIELANYLYVLFRDPAVINRAREAVATNLRRLSPREDGTTDLSRTGEATVPAPRARG